MTTIPITYRKKQVISLQPLVELLVCAVMDAITARLQRVNRDWKPSVYVGKSQAELKREHEDAGAFWAVYMESE